MMDYGGTRQGGDTVLGEFDSKYFKHRERGRELLFWFIQVWRPTAVCWALNWTRGAYKKEREVRLPRLPDLEGAVGTVPLHRVPPACGLGTRHSLPATLLLCLVQ